MTEKLEHEAAIRRVLIDYCTGIDRRDWARFRACFADECRVEYGAIGSWSSAEALTESMRQMHLDWGFTLHRLSNVVVDVEGEGAQARSYVDAVLMAVDGGRGHQAFAIYDDILGRSDDRWKITERDVTLVLQRPLAV